ncbi:metallophosphoesterase [Halodesulfovibrio sp. MK-HDV]|uniref:metallophosphoesterase family protein n=1 Tax=Halodesulfovibrio sp. MK-HDV TaxID=2599925 RepID=UPI0013683797|nr:metallophosphoesterase [Halodesulfovibrio sp. MK-HDV]KAF1074342.1 3',5'-cyclic adenosine monophosphate phosphodiesterase CpdA [Halodesulfovibrio sp. MK-HDV]
MKNQNRRQFLQTGAFTLMGMSLMGRKAFAAPTKTDFAPVRFGVISDPHLDIKGKNGMKMSAASVNCVGQAVKGLNQETGLSFVVVTGDLLLDGEKQNAEAIKELLDSLTVPYFVIAGNHDFVPANPAKHRDGFDYLKIEEFVKFFDGKGYDGSGNRYWAHSVVPGLRVIGLDANLPLEQKKWGGVLPQEQLNWLDKQLTDHKDEMNIVFMHHNVIPWSSDELKGGAKQWFCADNADAVRAVLEKHAEAAPLMITGHRHIGMRVSELAGVNYMVAPSANTHPMRYSVLTVSPEAVTWKTPMIGVPESVHIEARNNLLAATWWRETQYAERSATSDAEVLEFYEKNSQRIGTKVL